MIHIPPCGINFQWIAADETEAQKVIIAFYLLFYSQNIEIYCFFVFVVAIWFVVLLKFETSHLVAWQKLITFGLDHQI